MSQKVCHWVDVAQLSMTLMNRMYRFSRELHCLPFLLLHKPAKKARICIVGSEGEWISLSRLLSLPIFSAGITHYFSCFSALSLSFIVISLTCRMANRLEDERKTVLKMGITSRKESALFPSFCPFFRCFSSSSLTKTCAALASLCTTHCFVW